MSDASRGAGPPGGDAAPRSPLPVIPGFVLRRRIGRGGSATVYLAEQERADFKRLVALKVIDRVVGPQSLRRVHEEQRILARLEHPGIARLYDAGSTPLGQPYLVVELVEGESILEHCRTRALPLRERLEIFLGALDAVAHAHAAGVVHRDLKPANILVSSRGEAKLLDFGIASLAAESEDADATRTLERALTPTYASPEQVRGGRVTAASDVYSLGVVLYELLAGTLPYRLGGGSRATLEDAIRTQEPEPPSDALARAAAADRAAGTTGDAPGRRHALRGDLDEILLKTLRKDPAERYASVAALAEDLRRHLAGVPITLPIGRRYRVARILRRRRRAVLAATVGLALGVVLVCLPRLGRLWRAATAAGPEAEFSGYASASADAETRRLLLEGAERMASGDPRAAREGFRRAIAREPGLALAWDGAARAEAALGEPGRAVAAAKQAGALAGARSGDDAERLRARALAAERRWERAIPELERLVADHPRRIDLWLDLVNGQLAAGRSDAANAALDRLAHALPEVGGRPGDPRIDCVEAEVALRLSELQRAAAAAERARERAVATGATVLALRAERLHAEAILRLDRRDEARRTLESLVERDLAAGLAGEAALARLGIGMVLLKTAGNDAARRVLEEALAGLRDAGSRPGEVVALVQLSLLAGKRGEFEPALGMSNEALATARAIGDRWAEGYALSQRLVLLNWADDEAGMTATAGPTLAALRDSGNRQTLVGALANLALASVERLELAQAEAYVDEAEALGRRVGSQPTSGRVDRARGYLEQTRGDFDLARRSYLSGLEKARLAGVPLEEGYFLFQLAWLEVEAERTDPAERVAKEAIAAFRAGGDPRLEADVEPVLAWVDARRGNVQAAHRRLAELRKRAAPGSGSSGFNLLTGEARVAEALGEWTHAIALRRKTVSLATEWKAAGLLMDQRVGLARALHGRGDRAELERLVAELLPEVERLGLRGAERSLRGLLAAAPH